MQRFAAAGAGVVVIDDAADVFPKLAKLTDEVRRKIATDVDGWPPPPNHP
jgi:hypothetical protein